MTISNSNSFDLFSYGSESVFWYFQFQGLISDFSDNPLKLHKIPAYYLKFAQTEIYVFHFAKKARFVRFGVNGTTFLQDIQRKKRNQISLWQKYGPFGEKGHNFSKKFKRKKKKKKGVKKKKVGKKTKGQKNVRQKSALPSSYSSTFYLSSPVPTTSLSLR